MRVIAGQLRGRRLRAPAAARPTLDRVREALFSILGDLEGAAVLDLFAGSGALGIEALSRGARSAEFVDRSRDSADTVEANLTSLGLVATVHREDALHFLDRCHARGRTFDLVFCDPPYDCAPRLAGRLTESLGPVLAPEARIVTESDKRTPLELGFPLERERTYGDTRVAVHRG